MTLVICQATYTIDSDDRLTVSALGNSLNVFAHTMLYALVSGRQIVVGNGHTLKLLCGPIGAFECGLPFHATYSPGGNAFR